MRASFAQENSKNNRKDRKAIAKSAKTSSRGCAISLYVPTENVLNLPVPKSVLTEICATEICATKISAD